MFRAQIILTAANIPFSGGVLTGLQRPAIRERARLVLTGILDEADVSRYLDGVPSPGAVKAGFGPLRQPASFA